MRWNVCMDIVKILLIMITEVILDGSKNNSHSLVLNGSTNQIFSKSIILFFDF